MMACAVGSVAAAPAGVVEAAGVFEKEAASLAAAAESVFAAFPVSSVLATGAPGVPVFPATSCGFVAAAPTGGTALGGAAMAVACGMPGPKAGMAVTPSAET